MNYSIIISLNPEIIGGCARYFWYISDLSEHDSSNYGFGWSNSESDAFNDAIDYYNKNLK